MMINSCLSKTNSNNMELKEVLLVG